MSEPAATRAPLTALAPTLGVRAHVVDALADLLAQAQAGKIRACVLVAYQTDGAVFSECAAEATGELVHLSAGVTRAQYMLQQRLDEVSGDCSCEGPR